MTVLFADLSGYTAASERMDPEQVKALVDGALQRLGEEVDRFGGTVDKYIGDNVMALFGAPVAHEDDAERAVRAGLGMQEAMGEINERLSATHGTTFALRVGVNTGEVVAGAVGDAYTVVGDAVNVASRLQSAAERGSVTVGERTMRATARRDRVPGAGSADAEGQGRAGAGLGGGRGRRRSSPAPGHRCPHAAGRPRPRARPARVARPARGARAPGSPRDRHRRGRCGQVAAARRAPAPPGRRRGPPRGPRRPLSRLRVRGRLLGAGRGAARGVRDRRRATARRAAWQKLAQGVEGGSTGTPAPGEAERQAATIARLLGIGSPQGPGADEEEDPQRLRESFFAAIRALIEAIAADSPLVIAFEDIHWADDGMLDLIDHLAQRVRAPLLVLCLTRDSLLDRRTDWGSGRRNATSLGLAAADRRRDPRPGGRAAAVRERRGRGAGGRALRGQPAVRRGDGAPGRGGRAGRRAARQRPGRAGRPARLAAAVRAAAGAARVGERPHLLAGIARRRWLSRRAGTWPRR